MWIGKAYPHTQEPLITAYSPADRGRELSARPVSAQLDFIRFVWYNINMKNKNNETPQAEPKSKLPAVVPILSSAVMLLCLTVAVAVAIPSMRKTEQPAPSESETESQPETTPTTGEEYITFDENTGEVVKKPVPADRDVTGEENIVYDIFDD